MKFLKMWHFIYAQCQGTIGTVNSLCHSFLTSTLVNRSYYVRFVDREEESQKGKNLASNHLGSLCHNLNQGAGVLTLRLMFFSSLAANEELIQERKAVEGLRHLWERACFLLLTQCFSMYFLARQHQHCWGTLLEMHTVPNTMESATLGGASNLSLMTVGDPGYFNLRESPRTSPVRWDDSSSFRELLPDSSLPFLVLKRI